LYSLDGYKFGYFLISMFRPILIEFLAYFFEGGK